MALLGLPVTALAGGAQEPARLAQCSWDKPGQNPFMGDVVAAVDRYTDIPVAVRERLKQRMVKRDYEDIASIRRDSIEGKARYEPAIRDMHFGVGRVCSTVSRKAWLETQQERGLVYCEGTECIIVPTVCRNVSRIRRDPSAVLASRDLLAPDAASPADTLLFDPPSAGLGRAQPYDYGYVGGGLAPGDPGVTVAGADPGIPGIPGVPGASARDPDGRDGPAGGARTPESAPVPVPVPVPGGVPAPLPPSASVLPSVPEPQTWRLLLLGVAAWGALQWRRRAQRQRLNART